MKTADRKTAEGILFTDQYQLTMAQLYFRMGIHEQPAQFDHFFRKYPDYGIHQAGYCVNAGMEWLLDWLAAARFREEDLAYMRGMRGKSGDALFSGDFLSWLAKNGHFGSISMRAIPEGRVVHANAPLTVVTGPLAMAQILESPLLNHLNYPTLIATKAARIHAAACGGPVLEFGMRRAQERGANAGVRGALIGGADFSSNAGISHVLGMSPRGTHAHSMVQAFMALGGSEIDAFRAYGEVYPDDCLLLVDTVNTLASGVPNAIRVFEELRRKGHQPVGIRLDSGDLAYLAIQSAKMLDDAGFPDAKIVLSNELDELVIWQIISQINDESRRAGVDPDRLRKRLIYGVGTRLITSRGASALDGVYKLAALRRGGKWLPAIKISESPAKTLNPGNKQVWRLYDRRGKANADLLCLDDEDPRREDFLTLHHPTDHAKFRTLAVADIAELEPLLIDIVRDGRPVHEPQSIEDLRRRRQRDEEFFDSGVRRLINPHVYHVSLSGKLWDLKQKLIDEARKLRKSD
ncbi:MAG: nicotinate phosphoribosyltransferase [Desulfobulbaceae bacterium]|nr:nicotinate phosphoribosyltransferase [Desulfobulbaceae bacterium]